MRLIRHLARHLQLARLARFARASRVSPLWAWRAKLKKCFEKFRFRHLNQKQRDYPRPRTRQFEMVAGGSPAVQLTFRDNELNKFGAP